VVQASCLRHLQARCLHHETGTGAFRAPLAVIASVPAIGAQRRQGMRSLPSPWQHRSPKKSMLTPAFSADRLVGVMKTEAVYRLVNAGICPNGKTLSLGLALLALGLLSPRVGPANG
jgi:hypothetical protein